MRVHSSKRSLSKQTFVFALVFVWFVAVTIVRADAPVDTPAVLNGDADGPGKALENTVSGGMGEGAKEENVAGEANKATLEEQRNATFNETLRTLKSLARRKSRRTPTDSSNGDLLQTAINAVIGNVLPGPLGELVDEVRQRILAHVDSDGEQGDVGEEAGDEDVSWTALPGIEEGDSWAVKRTKALRVLRALANDGHDGAVEIMGDMLLYGVFQHPRNASRAFNYYSKLAHDTGRPAGQRQVGLMYATGIGVERDYAKALLYLSFAVVGGDTIAEQALGYWHLMGIATPRNCDDAVVYYRRVAEKAVERFNSGPPGGLAMPLAKMRLPDQDGGVYGFGASGTGDPNLRSGGRSGGAMSTEDILQYYRLQADGGDPLAQLLIGQLFYLGSYNVKQNFQKAMLYFRQVASQHPGLKPARGSSEEAPQTVRDAATSAMGFIGQMYWRGEGVDVNLDAARKWFEKGAEDENGVCLHGLAVMYIEGLGVPRDPAKGLSYLNLAAKKDHADAQVRLGKMYFARGKAEYQNAMSWFNAARNKGHIVALYHLGEMHEYGYGLPAPTCHVAVLYYKSVAEKGDWHDPTIHAAPEDFRTGDYEGAFIKYLFAAERGYEVAQTNAAWIIDRGYYNPEKTGALLPPAHATKKSDRTDVQPYDAHSTALYLWNRAANQGNVNARVKMGDYYYYGQGVPKAAEAKTTETTAKDGVTPTDGDKSAAEPETAPVTDPEDSRSFVQDIIDTLNGYISSLFPSPTHHHTKGDPQRAAVYYQVAADNEFSSIAMWNLGWMHEKGIGVAQDYHLAKRFYDRCLVTNPEAYLPVNLALAKLRLKMFWRWVKDGGLWSGVSFPSFLGGDEVQHMDFDPVAGGGGGANDAVMGGANRKTGEGEPRPHRQQQHNPWDDYYEYDDFLERFGEDAGGLDDDGFGVAGASDSFIIVMLCGVAAALLAWRQGVLRRRQEEIRRGMERLAREQALVQQQQRRPHGGVGGMAGASGPVVPDPPAAVEEQSPVSETLPASEVAQTAAPSSESQEGLSRRAPPSEAADAQE
ncbi:uncharacterized protein EV422DRAFT_566297 [Fimicolochytrium jonesii]|uniref:uncharacterized protein n=1 Tax=Fimicolochytrium jonesii TaxID=1396493 RepID=UPI0022FEAB14|nr:uncharacterized protein EV422DRAFT_566297 [Fimicolochytrium jonesii]KAI8822620.1 hypothetical protein EV422DRAFT_566297 [Fimicolochytrium jonesii]